MMKERHSCDKLQISTFNSSQPLAVRTRASYVWKDTGCVTCILPHIGGPCDILWERELTCCCFSIC